MRHQGQAETVAGAGAGAGVAVEVLEDALAQLGRDAGALVVDLHDEALSSGEHPHAHGAGRELQRVVDAVADQRGQERVITPHQRVVFRQLERQALPVALLGQVFDHVNQRDQLVDGARSRGGQGQEPLDQRGHGGDPVVEARQLAFEDVGRGRLLLQQLQLAEDLGQRRAQLVGGVRGEAARPRELGVQP